MKKKLKQKSPFDDVPILFVSALTKNRLIKSIEVALSVFKNTQKITTSKLNDTMLDIIKNTPPPAVKGEVY